jgi:hypothetical protein
MVPTTHSDHSGALEHILTFVPLEPPPVDGSTSIPHFHTCLSKAGVPNVSDFVPMDPSAYGSISFAIGPLGDEDHQLTIIQVKKSKSLFFWYHHVTTWSHRRWPRLQWGCHICQNLSKLTTSTKFDSARPKSVNVLTYGTKTSMPMQL